MSVDEFQLARNFWGYLSYKGTNFIVINTSDYLILKSDMKHSVISRAKTHWLGVITSKNLEQDTVINEWIELQSIAL